MYISILNNFYLKLMLNSIIKLLNFIKYIPMKYFFSLYLSCDENDQEHIGSNVNLLYHVSIPGT